MRAAADPWNPGSRSQKRTSGSPEPLRVVNQWFRPFEVRVMAEVLVVQVLMDLVEAEVDQVVQIPDIKLVMVEMGT